MGEFIETLKPDEKCCETGVCFGHDYLNLSKL